MEDLKDMSGKTTSKLVVTFKGRKKALVMNRTNYDAVADLHGEETNNWPGKFIELYRPRPARAARPWIAFASVARPLRTWTTQSRFERPRGRRFSRRPR
jgi:hypothetical protein